jgi:hypothetical protein
MRLKSKPRLTKTSLFFGFLTVAVCLIVAAYFMFRSNWIKFGRSGQVMSWLRNPEAHPEWAVSVGERCGTAPFLMPTNGFIGFVWDDSFRIGHRHQGIDIFGGTAVNQTPVIAAYAGFLTRLPDWKSTVIIRIPEDPLLPGRQIWTYYTHLAGSQGESFISEQFPAGTYERHVEAGELLGYQGNYSGTAGNPVGVHLHFSIVLDDGAGQFLNELEIENTLDPSPYLGLALNAKDGLTTAPVCPD